MKYDFNPAQVIHLAGAIFHEMKYYNIVSNLFEQDADSRTHCKSNRGNLLHINGLPG